MRVAFVTTSPDPLIDEDIDRPLHEQSFAAAGIELDYQLWQDPVVEWASYDLVVLRSPWDYMGKLEEFLQWLNRVEQTARVENPPSVVRWNLDKHEHRKFSVRSGSRSKYGYWPPSSGGPIALAFVWPFRRASRRDLLWPLLTSRSADVTA